MFKVVLLFFLLCIGINNINILQKKLQIWVKYFVQYADIYYERVNRKYTGKGGKKCIIHSI